MSKAIEQVLHCTTMAEVRRAVDALDDQLVPLLVQRLGYMLQAARIKQAPEQVRDEARIAAIVERVRARAQAEGGPPEVLEAIYRALMETCIAFEQREFERLHSAPANAPASHAPASVGRGVKLLMIDNYDSFTYNLVQYFGELGAQVQVLRNDEVTLAELDALFQSGRFERLCISPGPCSPAEAGVSVPAIRHFAGKLPILGVCLGHQAIGAAFGGRIVRARTLMHGKTSPITTTQQGVFAGLPRQFTVNRYHSLVIERATCPPELQITATSDDDGEIQGVRHTGFADAVRIEGVQFHPESILTEHGHAMLANFLR
jgi:glutamine amidotransferase of anthranilate synthase or aminodeoxychorismate synthase